MYLNVIIMNEVTTKKYFTGLQNYSTNLHTDAIHPNNRFLIVSLNP